MNLDLDEIMVFSSQCASEIVREYAMLCDLKGLPQNLGFLTSQITRYLCKDIENSAIRKCAVNWQVGILISQARKVASVSENARPEAIKVLNELHKNFVTHCEGYEATLFQIQNAAETPNRSMKM